MTVTAKAKSADYGLGEFDFARGWFVIAEASELDDGPIPVDFFDKEFVLYRGESGKVFLLDAYCKHMGTHMGRATSASVVRNGNQIVGDNILCPYHAWEYGSDGELKSIPFETICPKSAAIESYTVEEVMGCIMMWHDPEGGKEPDYPPPYIPAWDQQNAQHWKLDHLGEIPMHNVEVLDNICDVRHLGPTHGSPCEYFENEIRDFQIIQRQGGVLETYDAKLDTVTWYTGPGILISKQTYAGITMYEFIAGTAVTNGTTRAWHGVLCFSESVPPTQADLKRAREQQAAALDAFSTDFVVWTHKKPALKVMQTPHDGNFRTVRKWVRQFYNPREVAKEIQAEVNGIHTVKDFPQPSTELRDAGYEDDCFKLKGQF